MESQKTDRLERLMDTYGTQIKRFCALELKDAHLAEDAAQDVFVKAWKHLDSFRGDCNEKTWLIRIAVNTCRDYQRTGWFRFMDRKLTPDDLPEQSAPNAFPDGTVAAAVRALPTQLRTVVLLHFYEGMTLQETAQAMDVSTATVKRRLQKATDTLNRKLKGWYEDGE